MPRYTVYSHNGKKYPERTFCETVKKDVKAKDRREAVEIATGKTVILERQPNAFSKTKFFTEENTTEHYIVSPYKE